MNTTTLAKFTKIMDDARNNIAIGADDPDVIHFGTVLDVLILVLSRIDEVEEKIEALEPEEETYNDVRKKR